MAVDIPALARQFIQALGQSPDQALARCADDVVYDVQGFIGPLNRDALARYLGVVHDRLAEVEFQVEDLVMKRNLVFVQWRNTGILTTGERYENHGVHVLAFDQDGRVCHAQVHTQTDALRRLVGDEEAATVRGADAD